jgi:hypothetical protein
MSFREPFVVHGLDRQILAKDINAGAPKSGKHIEAKKEAWEEFLRSHRRSSIAGTRKKNRVVGSGYIEHISSSF